MRFDPDRGKSAGEIINRADEKELARIIGELGEERRAHAAARAIVRARQKGKIDDAKELASVIARAIGPKGRWRIHPATRTFMALRIYVNDELGNLERFIASSVRFLRPGGPIVIISFHSLEDRIVKLQFRALAQKGDQGGPPPLTILTKKPVSPAATRSGRNPRARSAKLRAAQRTHDG